MRLPQLAGSASARVAFSRASGDRETYDIEGGSETIVCGLLARRSRARVHRRQDPGGGEDWEVGAIEGG